MLTLKNASQGVLTSIFSKLLTTRTLDAILFEIIGDKELAMSISMQDLNFYNTVNYHYDKFPPEQLDYEKMLAPFRAKACTIYV